jgi:hypothetical protein
MHGEIASVNGSMPWAAPGLVRGILYEPGPVSCNNT